eukprot:Sro1376_g267450.1 PQQ (394) ;mRNA; r:10815-11996
MAHPEVAAMRRSLLLQDMLLDWPTGSLTKFSRPVKKVALSPDNQQLCVAYCKSKVVIYDKLRGPQYCLKGHAGIIADVKFSPSSSDNKNSILATAGKGDGTIRLWRKQTTNSSASDSVKKNKISNRKNRLSPSSSSPPSSSYQCYRILQVHQPDLRHMLWSPSGTHIASWGQDGSVRVSDISDGSLKTRHWKTRFEVSHCHETVAFGPGHELAYARNNDRLHLWNWKLDTVQLLGGLHDPHGTYAGGYITSVAYSPDGLTLVVGCHVATIKMWRLVPHRRQDANNNDEDDDDDVEYEYVFTKQLHLGDGWSAVTLLTFTRDGRYLACSNHGSQIRIVDTTTDQILATFKGGHTSRIESLCFSADGRTLASGACDRTVRLWDTSRLLSSSSTTP